MNQYRRLTMGISSIRGVVGERLQPELAADFAAAFGGFLGKGTVIVARDTRPSGVMLEHAVISGLLAAGCKVISAGILPTPSLQLAVKEHSYAGAIAITASQHPREWNALKFINQDGRYLSQSEMAALFDIYNQPEDGFLLENSLRGLEKEQNFFEEHAKKIWTRINTAAIRAANLKVAVDCGNGVGALYTRRFLKNLGVDDIIVLNENADGIFREMPDPSADELAELSACVRENHCDMGFAQDPDGDSFTLLDESGKVFSGQKSILLAAKRVLERTPGNVSASVQITAALEDMVKAVGGNVFYTRIGEANIAQSIVRNNGVFGAEGGGVIWPEVHCCRDSFAAMALTLEKTALSKKKITEQMSELPEYHSAVLTLECRAKEAEDALRSLAKKYERFHPELLDGVRIAMGKVWVLARKSYSESAIRIYTESAISKADAMGVAETIREDLNAFCSDPGRG